MKILVRHMKWITWSMYTLHIYSKITVKYMIFCWKNIQCPVLLHALKWFCSETKSTTLSVILFACIYFCELKKNRISRVLVFCEKRVFENFEFINFSPKEKGIRKRQLNQGTFGSVFVKINGKTGRSRWKKYCYWLVLKKA